MGLRAVANLIVSFYSRVDSYTAQSCTVQAERERGGAGCSAVGLGKGQGRQPHRPQH